MSERELAFDLKPGIVRLSLIPENLKVAMDLTSQAEGRKAIYDRDGGNAALNLREVTF